MSDDERQSAEEMSDPDTDLEDFGNESGVDGPVEHPEIVCAHFDNLLDGIESLEQLWALFPDIELLDLDMVGWGNK